MKTPRIEDFHPDADRRTLATPLDGMPAIEKPRVSSQILPSAPSTQPSNKPARTTRTAERSTLNGQQDKANKFEKYSTYLRPGYLKKIKLAALEKDCDSYEILDEALTHYFDGLKK
jgi:hypothetical protein